MSVRLPPHFCNTHPFQDCGKIVVSKWLRAFTPASSVIDQYGFEPTGSTTASLTSVMHNVTNMLKYNNYVRCFMIDFSTAVDTVDHIVLLKKLQLLGLPANIFNWLISFLTYCVQ